MLRGGRDLGGEFRQQGHGSRRLPPSLDKYNLGILYIFADWLGLPSGKSILSTIKLPRP